MEKLVFEDVALSEFDDTLRQLEELLNERVD